MLGKCQGKSLLWKSGQNTEGLPPNDCCRLLLTLYIVTCRVLVLAMLWKWGLRIMMFHYGFAVDGTRFLCFCHNEVVVNLKV